MIFRPVTESKIEEVAIFSATKTANLSEVEYKERFSSKETQTQFRESSAQTHPWQPDYKIIGNGDPEILKLDFLKWGAGLPAGMHEIRLIERARMKRSWEKMLPPIVDNESLEQRRKIIEALERHEWACREQEIQDIQDLRLELLEQMLNELHERSSCRVAKKMKLYTEMKEAEKQEKLEKIRKKSQRGLYFVSLLIFIFLRNEI